jgi:hypothetical protein
MLLSVCVFGEIQLVSSYIYARSVKVLWYFRIKKAFG